MYRIVHLSDLHFGGTHFFDQYRRDPNGWTLADAIPDAVRQHLKGATPDALILSGDFFSDEISQTLPLATEGIRKLIGQLGVSPECTFAVPGNHDLSWHDMSQSSPFWVYDQLVSNTGIRGFANRDLPAVCCLRPGEGDMKGIALAFLDSCRMEGKKTAGIGRVGEPQIAALRRLLHENQLKKETHLLIAVLHHHLLPVMPLIKNWRYPDPKKRPPIVTSLTVDAVAVLHALTELGFTLALHGHQHRPAVHRFEDVFNQQPTINVCAAGSCAAKEEGVTRQFFLYELESFQTRVWSFAQSRSNDQKFDCDPAFVDLFNSPHGSQLAVEHWGEVMKGGLLAFYSDRKGSGERALQEVFESHREGEIRMIGASLRLFLSDGHPMCSFVNSALKRHHDKPVAVRAVFSSPDDNRELPIRSFVEDFGPDGSWPRDKQFDWRCPISIDLREFERQFFPQHGTQAGEAQRVRAIQDLQGARVGVMKLSGVARASGNEIRHRETLYAPYCTAVIFPDRVFYTPNLLSTELPVNLPMLVFSRTSKVYEKLAEYFEFQWWASAPGAGQIQ